MPQIAFLWRIDCLSEITATFVSGKGKRFATTDVKWLSDHHLIHTIEKDRENNDSVNIGDQEQTNNIRSDSQLLFPPDILMPTSKLHS